MSLAVVAIGIVLGLARGGRLGALLSVRPSWWGLIAGGFLLQAFAENVDVWQAESIVVIGMFLLIVGLAANAAIRGALIAAFGVALNLIVFVLNGAVPIRFEALEPAGLVAEGTLRAEIRSVGHLLELETSATRLGSLGDTIPVGFLQSVISIGDLVTFAGVIVILSNLIAARRRVGVDIDEVFAAPSIAFDLEPPPDERAVTNAPPSDAGILDIVDDDPIIDISDPTVPSRSAVSSRSAVTQPGANTYDPDDLWADDDTGVRILGPSSKSR